MKLIRSCMTLDLEDNDRTYVKFFSKSLQQIHQLVMSLNYTGIEIKTAHSLESWNGGVLVMVSGSVHAKDFNGRKKFIETFFLAPQEKGYFVLNDIFHYVDEEQILQHPIAYLSQSNIDSNLHSSATVGNKVDSFILILLENIIIFT
ncbi:UNVERIFIED_CONTAM: Nuclear transport factor 2 [Sesamum angustifolium]|uniref:Nuclear transport factor 2 n=1 Tax=Sesamum angustifolium TaxID=2727405 RepID=A0AAW2LTR7_9LAMI